MKTNDEFSSNVKSGLVVVLSILVVAVLVRFGPPVKSEVTSALEMFARKTEQYLTHRYSSARQL